MGLLAAATEGSNSLRDAKLVGLFLQYLEKENALTPEEAIEAARFDKVVEGLVFAENAWKDDLRIASNRMIFPDDPGNLADKPDCPGPCCATVGSNCSTWSIIAAFI